MVHRRGEATQGDCGGHSSEVRHFGNARCRWLACPWRASFAPVAAVGPVVRLSTVASDDGGSHSRFQMTDDVVKSWDRPWTTSTGLIVLSGYHLMTCSLLNLQAMVVGTALNG